MKGKRVAAIIGAALAVVLLGNRGFRRIVSGAVELHRLRGSLGALQKEEEGLREQLRDSRTSDSTVESAARRELGYVKPGELEYRFPPPKKDAGRR